MIGDPIWEMEAVDESGPLVLSLTRELDGRLAITVTADVGIYGLSLDRRQAQLLRHALTDYLIKTDSPDVRRGS